MEKWFVDSTGVLIDWDAAVVDGVATEDIVMLHRFGPDDRPSLSLFAHTGTPVAAEAQAAAEASASTDPLPEMFHPPAGPAESGGSSTVGAPVVRAFPFAFDTAGLVTGYSTGYTPAVGDVLLGAWVEIGTAWDGTTPSADIGQFTGTAFGWWGWVAAGPLDLTTADEADALTPGLLSGGAQGVATDLFTAANVDFAIAAGPKRFLPAKFTAAHPVKVCVSTTGATDGDDPGATQGSATLYLVTATPA